MTATNVNWVKVQAAYCAGLLPVSQIAKQAGISEATIRYHAKKRKWRRDLTARVRARTAEKLTLALAEPFEIAKPIRALSERTEEEDEETVENAALTQIAVVRSHSAGIRRGMDITQRLMQELDTTTTHADELGNMFASEDDGKRRFAAERAVSLPGRAAVMRDLAQAARVWINLERQAFRISDDRSKEQPSAVNEMTEDELRASIIEDLQVLGIEAPKPKGIAPPAKAQGVVPKKG